MKLHTQLINLRRDENFAEDVADALCGINPKFDEEHMDEWKEKLQECECDYCKQEDTIYDMMKALFEKPGYDFQYDMDTMLCEDTILMSLAWTDTEE